MYGRGTQDVVYTCSLCVDDVHSIEDIVGTFFYSFLKNIDISTTVGTWTSACCWLSI